MKWHRHIGVYGICKSNSQLLVIHKKGGPYNKRFDLPGGSINQNETLEQALHREFIEETGLEINLKNCIGVIEFIVPWTRDGFDHTHCHHIAIFYDISILSGDILESPKLVDSLGAEWIDIDCINTENSSPLVIEAVNWIRNNTLINRVVEFQKWTIY